MSAAVESQMFLIFRGDLEIHFCVTANHFEWAKVVIDNLNKLAKAWKTRKSPGTLGLKKVLVG